MNLLDTGDVVQLEEIVEAMGVDEAHIFGNELRHACLEQFGPYEEYLMIFIEDVGFEEAYGCSQE